MSKNIKVEMRKRARAAEGLLNLLKDDIDQIRSDATDFDVICLETSLQDAKSTLQMIGDKVAEMEYMLYLVKQKKSVM